MRTINILLIALLILPTLVFADNMVCSIKSSCSAGETDIFEMYDLTNSHSGLSGSGYANKICCTNSNAVCSSPGSVVVLKLSSAINAHAELSSGTAYSTSVCLASNTAGQTILCSYGSTAPSSEYTCLGSIYDVTNSHVGNCNAYTTKIWCRNVTKDATDTVPPTVTIKVRIVSDNTIVDPNNQWFNKTLNVIAQCNDSKGCLQTKLQIYTSNPPSECSNNPNDYAYSGGSSVESTSFNQNVTVCAMAIDVGLNVGINDNNPSLFGNQSTEIKIDKITPSVSLEKRMSTVATICRDNESGCNNDKRRILEVSSQSVCPVSLSSYSSQSFYTQQSATVITKWFCGYGEDNAVNANNTLQSQRFRFGPCNYNGVCDNIIDPKEYGDTCSDCPICVIGDNDGDGQVCDRSLGENELNCPIDCPSVCNNNTICELGETFNSCPNDCTIYTCGNGYCDASENQNTCPTDCNDPPTIIDAKVTPNPINTCQPFTFSLNAYDQNGIASAFACKDPNCANKYCIMETTDGYTFSCTISDCSIGTGSYNYYINVSDTRGATTEISGLIGVTDFAADAIFEYPQLAYGTVLKLSTGEPNFTRSMPVNFTVYPVKRKASDTNYIGALCDKNCIVTYKINSSSTETVRQGQMTWQELSKKFIASEPTDSSSGQPLTCDQYYIIEATMSHIPGFVNDVVKSANFYLNCVPRVTVTPNELRYALGQTTNKKIQVTLWNPKEDSTYDLSMISSAVPQQNIDFVKFDCSSESQCTDSLVTVTIPEASYKTFKVIQTMTPRAGSFPIKFIATRR